MICSLTLAAAALPQVQSMYVCICNAVTDKMIHQAAADGVSTLAELTRYTGCAGNCGSCTDLAEQVLSEAHSRRPFGLQVFAAAA